ncbi:MAG: DUF962 domain-containing protein [Alphaproteobacteria bacterium]|nr:DUF962 domain-containing protein [Alphaproteobacteria bacterium]
MAAPNRIESYARFWPYYLGEHSRPLTRAIHYAGTSAAILSLILLLLTGRLWLVPIALFSGYAPAWIAHFFVEKNRPATFTYPLWSLASDVRMTFLWLTGRLGPDLARSANRKS